MHGEARLLQHLPAHAGLRGLAGLQLAAQAVAANSYTEGQARSAIESAGYTNVGTLTKSGTGLWQGPATKDGQTLQVSVDFKGSVTAMTPTPGRGPG